MTENLTPQARSESTTTFSRHGREFVLRARQDIPVDGRHNLAQTNEDVLAVRGFLVERGDLTQQLTEALGYRHRNRGKVEIEVSHEHYNDPNIGEIYTLSHRDNRVYVSRKESGWEIVYASRENNRSSFRTFEDFLHSPRGFQPEIAPGKPKRLAMFGTINYNLPQFRDIPQEQRPEPWMKNLSTAVASTTNLSEDDIFNPDLGFNSQSSANGGIDMFQFAQESHNLFGADVVAMRFEPLKGGLALAELRMAMLASVLTGHKLIVWLQPPSNDRGYKRSRAIAQADILYFKELFGDRLNMEYHGMDEPITFEQFTERVAEAVKSLDVKKQPTSTNDTLVPKERPERIVLSGSSNDDSAIARRLELKQLMAAIGKPVVDTFSSNFGSEITDDNELMKHWEQSRTEELRQMEQATGHLIYAGTGSLSPFAQLATALLFLAHNKSNLHGLVLNPALLDKNKTDSRDDYSASTFRSHLYQLHKIRALMAEVSQLSPEITSHINAISDGIGPVVHSFQPKRRHLQLS